LVAELAASGVDLRRFVSECIGFFRGVFLAHYAPNVAEIADEPPEVYELWKKAAQQISSTDVLRAVDLLADALVRLREGREERLMTELALIKLTRPETATDAPALIARMDRLERRLAKGGEVAAHASLTPSLEPEMVPETTTEEELAKAAAPLVDDTEPTGHPSGIDISFEQLKNVWPGLFGGLRDLLGARRWAFFREAVPAAVEGNTIVLEVAHDFHLTSLEQDDAVSPIVAAKASDLLGGEVKVRFRLREPVADGEGGIDLTQLHDDPDGDKDAASLLESELGATLVDDD
jgi:hypothetical protein